MSQKYDVIESQAKQQQHAVWRVGREERLQTTELRSGMRRSAPLGAMDGCGTGLTAAAEACVRQTGEFLKPAS